MGRGVEMAESNFFLPLYGRVNDTPRPCQGGQIASEGLGRERQTGLCATQRERGHVPDNLALAVLNTHRVGI